MKRINEFSRKNVEVTEVKDIWRNSDGCLYTVYKDEDNNYYIDACDGGPNIAQLNGEFANDEEAVKFAQEQLDSAEEEEA